MADEKYNTRNPAVKRILQEVREMQNNGGDEFMSLPVQDNIFEWQFAIRGPVETEFEGGIYHGRIQLPPEYPFRPPAFMLLSPNGRFETHTKICLSISQHHPEHWQPSWSVRTALVALIAFMPTKPDGALGSLDYTKEERRTLAIKSRAAAPKFGNSERQQLIDEIHECMLKKSPPVPKSTAESFPSISPAAVPCDENKPNLNNSETDLQTDKEPEVPENSAHELQANEDVRPLPDVSTEVDRDSGLVDRDSGPTLPDAQLPIREVVPARAPDSRGFVARLGLSDDLGLTVLAIGLTLAIIAILMKKVLTIYWIPTITDS